MSVLGRRLILIYAENPGIAFSQFQNLSGGRVVLSLVALAALALVIGYLRKVPASNVGTIAGLGLIWGGALGNVIDRVGHGSVTDFVLVNLGVWPFNPWPVFNVADAVLVAGVALMILARFRRAPDSARSLSSGCRPASSCAARPGRSSSAAPSPSGGAACGCRP